MPFTAKPKIRQTQLFINNAYVNSSSGRTFPTENPATEEVICQVQEGDKADIDAAVAAAKAAFEFDAPWRRMDASERGSILFKLADLIEADADYLASLESLDCGKTPASAHGDITFVVSFVRYYAGYADKLHGLTIPSDGDCFTFTRLEPVGVVGGIVPWNYPFQLAMAKLAPALAAGCTIVIKPAEQSPLTALLIGEYCIKAGVPAGVVNVVPGYGPTTGAALVANADVNKVSFTGSTEVGRLILQGSGASNLKRVSLELGGKSPLIICDDCPDLDEAATVAHQMALANHGQCCVAATRTFVQSGIYDRFVAKTKTLAESTVVGDPFDEKTEQGPMIDKIQTDKIMELIQSGKQAGATLVTGGSRVADRRGYFIQPTVFSNVKDDMRIAKEEIFGPVQSIFRFDKIDEAVKRANDTNYGLGAGVFTKDVQTALYVSQRLKAGSVWVNTYLQMSAHTPFGGFKESGHEREFGFYGIEPFLERKTVTIALKNKIS